MYVFMYVCMYVCMSSEYIKCILKMSVRITMTTFIITILADLFSIVIDLFYFNR